MKTKLLPILFLSLLMVACKTNEPEVIHSARFSYTTKDLTVTFSNQSTNAVSYSWDFGDNSSIYKSESSTHKYSKTGSYNVTLVVTSSTGNTDKFSQSITLLPNATETPNANFRVHLPFF